MLKPQEQLPMFVFMWKESLISCAASNPHGSLEDKIPAIDRVIKICSALVNLCPAIVPFD